jgi:RNA polymerase sigma-70 factor (ECF subfamily)
MPTHEAIACSGSLPIPFGAWANTWRRSGLSSGPVTSEPSDGDLVVRARRGDAPAMEALAHRYLRASYAVALSVLRHPADAEDASQEALLTALRSLDQCRDPARFAAWLFQSVRHRALKQITRRRVRARHADEVEPGAVVEVDAGRVVLRQRLLSALERLTPVQREVVLLHDLEGWTHPEIAVALEISEVMSRQHLFVARRAMREHLANPSTEDAEHG